MEELHKIIKESRVIAVVGISPNPERPSYYVSERIIKALGKKISLYFVNPFYAGKTILGKNVLSSLKEIPEKIDIVDVFRNKDVVEEVFKEAVEVGAKYIWLQPGTENPTVIEKYKDKINIIEGACLGVVASQISY